VPWLLVVVVTGLLLLGIDRFAGWCLDGERRGKGRSSDRIGSVCCAPVRTAQGLRGENKIQWQCGRVEMITPQVPCGSRTCDASSTPPTAPNLAQCQSRRISRPPTPPLNRPGDLGGWRAAPCQPPNHLITWSLLWLPLQPQASELLALGEDFPGRASVLLGDLVEQLLSVARQLAAGGVPLGLVR
jgi:hypothetical protein